MIAIVLVVVNLVLERKLLFPVKAARVWGGGGAQPPTRNGSRFSIALILAYATLPSQFVLAPPGHLPVPSLAFARLSRTSTIFEESHFGFIANPQVEHEQACA